MSESPQKLLPEALPAGPALFAADDACLTDEEILLLLEPRSSASTRRLDEHLTLCPDCRDLVLAACVSLNGSDARFGLRQACCSTFEPGQVVARRYCIRGLLGRGGMGEVYEALDLASRTRVALKTVRANLCDAPRATARLMSELRLGRRVAHSNVCRMLRGGEHRGLDGGAVAFYAMQLIEGETLRKRLRRGALGVDDAVLLGRQALSGLRAIHDAGIVHRDLKSDNLMLGAAGRASRVVIIDFGLARPQRRARERVSCGSSVGSGSLAYMAPEQATGGDVGPAADIFSFGVVLFEAATGRLPFRGRVALRSGSRSRCEPRVLASRELGGGLPAWLAAFIDRCLQSNPADRFADAAQAEQYLNAAAW